MPRGGRRLVRTTMMTTSTPNAMHAQEIMPIQFIRFDASGLEATLLKGLFSGTLPTLGREISLEDEMMSETSPTSLGIALDACEDDDEAGLHFFFGLLDGEEEEEAGFDDGATEEGLEEGGVLEGCEEDGGGAAEDSCSGWEELSGGFTVWAADSPTANTLSELTNISNINIRKTDSIFFCLFIGNPP